MGYLIDCLTHCYTRNMPFEEHITTLKELHPEIDWDTHYHEKFYALVKVIEEMQTKY